MMQDCPIGLDCSMMLADLNSCKNLGECSMLAMFSGSVEEQQRTEFKISIQGFWLWVFRDYYDWNIVVSLDEIDNPRRFLIDSCRGQTFDEAYREALSIIGFTLADWGDDIKISPGWDEHFCYYFPNYSEEF